MKMFEELKIPTRLGPDSEKPRVSKLEIILLVLLFLMGMAGLYEYMTFRMPYLYQYLTSPVDDKALKAQGWEFVTETTQGDPPEKVEIYRRPNDKPAK